MRLNKAFLCLSLLLVVGGCQCGNIEPIPVAPLAAVTVECPASVAVGQTAQCTARATDEEGNPINYVPISLYRWESSDPAVAKVVSRGEVTGVKSGGPVTIRAKLTLGSVTREGTAQLTVPGNPGPTLHSTPITADETWREADNPHLVRCPSASRLEVNGANAPVTLTLEAGVEVLFEADCELRITHGALKAMGTQEKTIRMASSQTNPVKGAWRGVVFNTAGSASELSYVSLSHCGASAGEDACIAVMNGAKPVLRNVTVENSGTAGVVVADDGSAFGTGSTALSITGSAGQAMRIGANQARTIPMTGCNITSNSQNVIEVGGTVSETQTWSPCPGAPYAAIAHIMVEGATTPELTLAAGTEVRFGKDLGLYVGLTAPGGLIVDGTAGSTVLLTATTPSAGHWQGVHLYINTTSRFSHATIEYAGAGGNQGTGNLNAYGNFLSASPRPVLSNVTLQKSSKYGLVLWDGASFGPGSTLVSVLNNGGHAISIFANEAGTIPTTMGTISGNTPDAVELPIGGVSTTQTWPNIGIPYVVRRSLNVGAPSNLGDLELTLAAGTELRFDQDTAVIVGLNPDRPGALRAEGTAAAPIRFVPNTANPTKGYWRGLHFWYAANSYLNYAIVTHAGRGGSIGTGNVNVYREIDTFVRRSTLSDSLGCGITRSTGSQTNSTPVTTDFTASNWANVFTNNDGGTQCDN